MQSCRLKATNLLENIDASAHGQAEWGFAKQDTLGPNLKRKLDKLSDDLKVCDLFGEVISGKKRSLEVTGWEPHQIATVCDTHDANLSKVQKLSDKIHQMKTLYQDGESASQ